MGLVQGNVWGVSMDQKFLKDTPQFYSFSSVVHAEFCWVCRLFLQYERAVRQTICMYARAKNFPEFFRCQTGGGGLDQKFLKDTPQFCMFSSVVHAEFCWICGLFPQ